MAEVPSLLYLAFGCAGTVPAGACLACCAAASHAGIHGRCRLCFLFVPRQGLPYGHAYVHAVSHELVWCEAVMPEELARLGTGTLTRLMSSPPGWARVYIPFLRLTAPIPVRAGGAPHPYEMHIGLGPTTDRGSYSRDATSCHRINTAVTIGVDTC